MGRKANEDALTVRCDLKVSKAQEAWMDALVGAGRFKSKAEVLRLGLDTIMLAEHGQAVILTGKDADALRQVAKDMQLDLDTTVLVATYLLALIGTMAPELREKSFSVVNALQAQAKDDVVSLPIRAT